MGFARSIIESVIGRRLELPREMIERYPELADAAYRRGGIALNVGGWVLGASHVSGITIGGTIFLHRDAPLDEELLLHELRHIQQFREARTFPVRYLWQSLRRGYSRNPYEVDARRFAAIRSRMRDGEGDEEGGGG